MATKLNPARSIPQLNGAALPDTFMPAQSITREIGGLLVTLNGAGYMFIREKGRRVEAGPFDLRQLYQDGMQRQAGHAPLKPRKLKGTSTKVSRGLLSTGDGK